MVKRLNPRAPEIFGLDVVLGIGARRHGAHNPDALEGLGARSNPKLSTGDFWARAMVNRPEGLWVGF
ncbi:MAG: hypothetical protein CM15mP84_00080 [Cellvibrionales bacterium]|nr:MAG: hypothetical protein CM15mP84_00080 [Cellvibrionales bacterium]